ncbi:MAG TPA: hypothetical protein VMW53_01470 [archaeon]|nr:hypothetical protein [archaeon]
MMLVFEINYKLFSLSNTYAMLPLITGLIEIDQERAPEQSEGDMRSSESHR